MSEYIEAHQVRDAIARMTPEQRRVVSMLMLASAWLNEEGSAKTALALALHRDQQDFERHSPFINNFIDGAVTPEKVFNK